LSYSCIRTDKRLLHGLALSQLLVLNRLILFGEIFKTDGFSLCFLTLACTFWFIIDRIILILFRLLSDLDKIMLISYVIVTFVVITVGVGAVFVMRVAGLKERLIIFFGIAGIIGLLYVTNFLCSIHAELVLYLVNDALLPNCFIWPRVLNYSTLVLLMKMIVILSTRCIVFSWVLF